MLSAGQCRSSVQLPSALLRRSPQHTEDTRRCPAEGRALDPYSGAFSSPRVEPAVLCQVMVDTAVPGDG